jgi:hypothetical protein
MIHRVKRPTAAACDSSDEGAAMHDHSVGIETSIWPPSRSAYFRQQHLYRSDTMGSVKWTESAMTPTLGPMGIFVRIRDFPGVTALGAAIRDDGPAGHLCVRDSYTGADVTVRARIWGLIWH